VIGGWDSHCDSQGRLELAVHTTKKINLDITDAGPGTLTAECRGPDGDSVPVAVESQSGTRVRVLLTPRDAGEHSITLSFAGFPLPGCPMKGIAEGSTSGPVRVILTGIIRVILYSSSVHWHYRQSRDFTISRELHCIAIIVRDRYPCLTSDGSASSLSLFYLIRN